MLDMVTEAVCISDGMAWEEIKFGSDVKGGF
jgi:hypothetical protein